MGNVFDNDIKFVGGVGEQRAKLLASELGIRTMGDMLYYFPFRYIDRTRYYRIGEITENESSTLVQFRARITGFAPSGEGRNRRFKAFVSDPTGSAELTWFKNVRWIEKRLQVGVEYIIFGRPSFFRGQLQMVHPEVEEVMSARKRPEGLQGE